MGLESLQHEESIFANNTKDLFVAAYVDDLLVLSTSPKIIDFVKKFKKRFEVTEKDINEECDFLGCVIKKSASGRFTLNQTSYIENILNDFSEVPFKNTDTPLPLNYKFELEERLQDRTPVEQKKFDRFKRLTGQLNYLRYTRLELIFCIHVFSRFTSYNSVLDKLILNAVNYLRRYKHLERHFYEAQMFKNSNLVGFVDAAHANQLPQMRNTGGWVICFGATVISATSNVQRFITTSAGEAELRQMAEGAKNMLFYKGFLEEVQADVFSLGLLVDSKSSISTVNFPITKRFRFLCVYIAFVKETLRRTALKVFKIDREMNLADQFTRQGNSDEFKIFRERLAAPFHWKHATN